MTRYFPQLEKELGKSESLTYNDKIVPGHRKKFFKITNFLTDERYQQDFKKRITEIPREAYY